MWWPRRRRPAPEPAGPPARDDDEVSRRLRELAADWQREPGVRPWGDDDNPPAGEALAGPTQLLPTAGPLLTPAQSRSQGGGQR